MKAMKSLRILFSPFVCLSFCLHVCLLVCLSVKVYVNLSDPARVYACACARISVFMLNNYICFLLLFRFCLVKLRVCVKQEEIYEIIFEQNGQSDTDRLLI
jgi:hypothetical protein